MQRRRNNEPSHRFVGLPRRKAPLCRKSARQRRKNALVAFQAVRHVPSMLEGQQAHLEMIQGVINRLSQNSFLLKGWSVLLVSSLFALAAFNSNPLFVYLTYLPVIAFWGLDGYFLWQERLFRALYDRVRKLETGKIDFSMDTSFVKSQIGRASCRERV